jgi:hypothetical protein
MWLEVAVSEMIERVINEKRATKRFVKASQKKVGRAEAGIVAIVAN